MNTSSFHAAYKIAETLANHSHKAYFAGGWVRDFALGHPSSDIDLATDATPEEILNLFPRALTVGIAFGVVIVMVGSHHFEITTFRHDQSYSDGRHPDSITFSSPEEDAKRRDFTINGMFFDPLQSLLIDFVEGMSDLQKQVIRAIGHPELRFKEDRLRMLRAIRFACRLKFAIEITTGKAIQSFASQLFPAVAVERVWQELEKMNKDGHLATALAMMHRYELLKVIFPLIYPIEESELAARLKKIEEWPRNSPLLIKLIPLFLNPSLKTLIEIAHFFHTSNLEIQWAEKWFEGFSLENCPHASLAEWARYYACHESNICIQGMGTMLSEEMKNPFLMKHSERRKHLAFHINLIQTKRPLISAQILKGEGITPGKLMGLLLKEAESIAICQDLRDPESILKLLKTTPLWPHV